MPARPEASTIAAHFFQRRRIFKGLGAFFCNFITVMKMNVQALASGGLGIGFEDDAIAKAFEAALEVGDGSGFADLVEIGFAEIAIG